MAFEVVIEIRGLVDLVSDRSTTQPDQALMLMPNAKVPDAGWIKPPFLRFSKPHLARLLICEGSRKSGVPLADPVLERCGDDLPGICLMGRHVTLRDGLTPEGGHPGELSVDRDPAGDPNDPTDGRSTLHYLNDMDQLVGQAGKEMGGIVPELEDDFSSNVAQRLAARVLLSSGHLKVAGLWRPDSGKPYERIAFQCKPPPPPTGGGQPPADVFMAHSLRLSGEVDGDTLSFDFKSLASGADAEHLTLEPDPVTGRLCVIVENSPEDCHGHDNHFLAHYWLRDKQTAATAVFYPSAAGWVMGSGSNPQCSPGDNDESGG